LLPNNNRWNPVFTEHITQHSLLDRFKGYIAMEPYDGSFYCYGRASCPMCHEEICGPCGTLGEFLTHLTVEHTTEERMSNKSDLLALFRPLMDALMDALMDEPTFNKLLGWDYFKAEGYRTLLSELSRSADYNFESAIVDRKQQQN